MFLLGSSGFLLRLLPTAVHSAESAYSDKTKMMIIDFRKLWRDHSPLNLDGLPVEMVMSTKFLGVHMAENLSQSLNTSTIKCLSLEIIL